MGSLWDADHPRSGVLIASRSTVDLPLGDDAALWDYLTVLDQGSRLALLAHCLSFGINALHEKMNPYGAGISASGLTRRMAHADLVVERLAIRTPLLG